MSSKSIYHETCAGDSTASIIEDRRFYVYVYFDPFTREPFYVGKGTGNRAWVHLKRYNHNTDTNEFKKNKISKLLRLGGNPIVEIVKDGLTELEAYTHEASLIAHYGRRWNNTGCLTNIEEGFGKIGSPMGFRDKTPYEFRNIETGEVVVKNMDEMVEFTKASTDSIRALVKGSNKTCRGWCLNSTSDEELKQVRDKNVYEIINIATKERRSATQDYMIHTLGLSPSSSSMLVNRTVNQSNLWCLVENYQEDIKTCLVGVKYWFNNPELGLVVYKTQKEMCEEFGLSSSEICSVAKGNKISHCGWMKGKTPHKNFKHKDKTIYTLVHYQGERFSGCCNDVLKFIGTNKIKSVLEGKRNHANGWFLDYVTEEKLRGFRINGYDPFYHKFKNLQTGEEFVMKRKDFCEMINVNHKKLDKMFNHGHVFNGEWLCVEKRVGYTIPE